MIRVGETRSDVSLPVDENDVLFDDTAGAYDYRSGDSEYGRLGVYYCAFMQFQQEIIRS